MIFRGTWLLIVGPFLFFYKIHTMERIDLIKKIEELSKNAYKQYMWWWDEFTSQDERLDAHRYLDSIDFDKKTDDELEKIIEEYSRCSEIFN